MMFKPILDNKDKSDDKDKAEEDDCINIIKCEINAESVKLNIKEEEGGEEKQDEKGKEKKYY